MFARRFVGGAIVGLCLSAGLCAAAANAAAPSVPAAKAALADNEYQKLIADKGAAVVTVKFVMKMEMGGSGEAREFQEEAFGVMMDPKGIVLVSNFSMGGAAARMGRGGGGITVTPTQIKVLIGDDTEGVDAKLVTRDSDLDLAWVKIEKPSDKPYVSVDFSKSVEAKVGEPLLTLDRLDKFFDRVPMVTETKVGAIVKKPRTLVMPASEARQFGAAVFTTGGAVVGFSTILLPSEDDEEGAMSMNRFRGAIVVMPASEVVTATERAMKNPDGEAGTGDKKSETNKEEMKPADKETEKK